MTKMKKLTDICDIQYGYAFDSKCFTEDSSYPQLVRIRDVKKGYSETYYSGDYPEEYILSEGDLLVGMDGEFNIARWKCSGALLNQRVCRLTAKVGTNEEYLRFAMSKSLKEIEQRTAFVTVKHLSAKELNKLELDVPELSKQDKIADTLNRLERVIEARKEELEKLDNLIKARFVEMFGDVQHEEKYKGIQLRELCTTMSGGTPSTKFPEYYEGDIPWISTVSLGPNYIDGTTAKGYITQEAVDNSATKLIPAGNILFGTRVGVGKSSLNNVDICTNQDIVAIVGIDESKFNRLFIKHVLDAYQPYYDSIKKGATILGITGDDLKDTLIPNVPIEIQIEFEKFVNQVDKSKVAVQKALTETQLLFDSLMQQYFG